MACRRSGPVPGSARRASTTKIVSQSGVGLYGVRVPTPRRPSGSQASLREANRVRVVEAVKQYGGLTQVELAGTTGLSAATVSNIVKELVASGVLQTTPTTQSGRRALQVTLAHAAGLVIGVHFSVRRMRIALADGAASVIAEHQMPLARRHRADNELDRVAMLIADMLGTAGSSMSDLHAVAIALPAPVLRETGTTSRAGMLSGWDGLPVAEVMSRRLGRPVFVDNSAKLAALGELRYGALRRVDNAAYLDIGENISAGIILGGRVLEGVNGIAGGFGHMVVQEGGPACFCGNQGCLQAVAGGASLVEMVRPELGNVKLNDVVKRALTGDDTCIRALGRIGSRVGVAAANVANLLDIERIVVGGELAGAGEILIGPIRHTVERSVLVEGSRAPQVVPAKLGPRSATMGAIALAIDGSGLRVN